MRLILCRSRLVSVVADGDDGVQCLAVVDDGPFALTPFYGSKVRLTSHVVVRPAEVAVGKQDHPPVAVGRLHEVAVPRTLYLLGLSLAAAVGQNRVGRRRINETIYFKKSY